MPVQTIIGNTYYIYDSLGTVLAWPAGMRVAQIRLLALNTAAEAIFQVSAGTPFLEWRYIRAEAASAASSRVVEPSLYVIPMGGVRMQVGLIPTTLTACTAWIDFL